MQSIRSYSRGGRQGDRMFLPEEKGGEASSPDYTHFSGTIIFFTGGLIHTCHRYSRLGFPETPGFIPVT